MKHENSAISESGSTNGWREFSAEAWNAERGLLVGGNSLTFWIHCLEKYGGPILDVACGNGRFSIPLAAHGKGNRLVGVDLNEGFIASAKRMLQQINKSVRAGHSIGDPISANERAEMERPRLETTESEYRRLTGILIAGKREIDATFHVGDIVRLNLDERFRLAIMTSWTWTVLLNKHDQIEFLERLHAHLLPGGVFAFNMPMADLPVPVSNLAELDRFLQQAGFEIVETYGDTEPMRPFTGSPYDDYVIVAERR